MTSYTELVSYDGSFRTDMVLRDDGAYVPTGMVMGPDGTMVSYPGFADPDGLAYQAWVAEGNTPSPPVGPSLSFVQTSLCSDIDARAEAQRLRYITPGEAQMATYLLKRGQAMQALANQAADTAANKTVDQLAAAYPYMANEIGITVDPTSRAPATDIYGVARAVSTIAVVWQTLDLAIERARIAGKAAIAAATTTAAAQAVHDAVTWPAPPAS